MRKISVVVGAQYGSEAKGHVTQRLVTRAQEGYSDKHPAGAVVNVRVAGPNAGHTAYALDGTKYALRQVPVGAVTEGPVVLVIAPGSEIDGDVLVSELATLKADGRLDNKEIWISPSATLIEDFHKVQEHQAGMVEKIGSTAKGIGAARADRIMRTARLLINDHELVYLLTSVYNVSIVDRHYRDDDRVIVEGTQGYGLGLHTPNYPQVTSSDCRAIDFLAMAGINPWGSMVDIWAVARMFPIRVAGNSGYLLGETTWEALRLPPEKTTVTQKTRRVGQWDNYLVASAVTANGGPAHVRVALTMADQRFPEVAGVQSHLAALDTDLFDWIKQVEHEIHAKIGMVTTSPTTGFYL